MRYEISLETSKDAKEFIAVVSRIPYEIFIVSGSGLKINARSILGVILSMTFRESWVECEADIYEQIQKFIKSESNTDIEANSKTKEKFLENGFAL